METIPEAETEVPEEKKTTPEELTPEELTPEELTEEDKQVEFEILQECVAVVGQLRTRYFYLLTTLKVLSAKLAVIWWRRKVPLMTIVPSVKNHKLSLVSVLRDMEVLQDYLQQSKYALHMILHILYHLTGFEERRQMLVLVILRYQRFLETYCSNFLFKLRKRYTNIVGAIRQKKIWVSTDELLSADMVPSEICCS